MELTADIAKAIATQFSRPLNSGTFIGELRANYDDAYVVIPTGGPDPANWNSGKQVENYQQFDVYAFNKNVKTCFQMGFDARKFIGCLSCLQQATVNTDYVIKGVKLIGGLTDLGFTSEKKRMAKFTVQITHLAAC